MSYTSVLFDLESHFSLVIAQPRFSRSCLCATNSTNHGVNEWETVAISRFLSSLLTAHNQLLAPKPGF